MLPANLVFSVSNNLDGGTTTSLVQIDAQTLNSSVFYSEPNASYVLAKSWSPRGDLLIIEHGALNSSTQDQLCTLTRTGKLKSCFIDPSVSSLSEVYGSDNRVITWSADEQYVYYLTGLRDANDHLLRLIEVNTSTGQTTRIIYQYDLTAADLASNRPIPLISWTKSLDFLTIGTGELSRVTQGAPVRLLNLQTNQEQNLATLGTIVNGPSSSSLNPNSLMIYPDFSPNDTYIVAYQAAGVSSSNNTPPFFHFYVLNKQLQLIHTVDLPPLPAASRSFIPTHIPTWLLDETGFYLDGMDIQSDAVGNPVYTFHLFKYTLATNQMAEVFTAPYPANEDRNANYSADGILQLKVFPSGSHLAYVVYVSNTGNEGGEHPEVAVLSPQNGIQYYTGGFAAALDPLWVPPLKQ